MFLADENFPRPSLLLLREKGFKVQSVQEEFARIGDEKLIEIASSQNLIILTFDSDYGEIIFKYKSINPPTVIYFRNKGNNPLFAGEILLRILSDSTISLAGSFIVVEAENLRQRFYAR